MWHLDGNVATASCGDVALTVGLAEGDRKLLLQTSDSTLLANLWMMPAVSPLPLVDVYVRGHDLVCSMGPTETHPFATQLYWTIRHLDVAPAPLAAVSLLVSVRTDLLDTQPAVEIASEASYRALDTLDVDGGPAYVMPLREQLTLVDFAMPRDCARQSADESAAGRLVVERTLFDHFLEKGVIRTGRLFAAVMPGDVDQPAVTRLCHAMLATKLPLTT